MAQDHNDNTTQAGQTILIPSGTEPDRDSSPDYPDYESPLESPLPVYHFNTSLPTYNPQQPSQGFASPWTSHSSLEKQPEPIPTNTNTTILDEPLDADGFTASERREHIRSLHHLRAIRTVAISRLAIRFLSILVSGAAFLVILICILLFTRYRSTHHLVDPSDTDEPMHIDLTPTTYFASVSAIFTIVSLAINILCCCMPSLRKLSPLSNLVFGVVSVVGMAGWLTGCLFLEHGRGGGYGGKENFWYFVCNAARDYEASVSGGSATSAASDAASFTRFCNYTSNSWDLGILQLCLEILTFINVLIAWFMVRAGMLRAASRL